MSKRRRTRRKGASWWTAQVEAQQRSEMSQQAFCESRGLSYSSFTRWRRKVREAGEAARELVVSTAPSFIEIELPEVVAPWVRVNLGAVTVDFETLPPPAWVAELAAYEATRC